jgi:hypothetical protein
MTDKAILSMANQTSEILSEAPWHVDCKALLPSYNALLTAAKENHPEDSFLRALTSLDPNQEGDVNAPVLSVLLAQLRMALELCGGGNGQRGAGEFQAPPPGASSEIPGY